MSKSTFENMKIRLHVAFLLTLIVGGPNFTHSLLFYANRHESHLLKENRIRKENQQ